MSKKKIKETPMMRQYNSFKTKYPGALLLFRVGDFYETFGEDAITASKILGITLTKRHNGAASEIELAGFPHHSLEAYLPKLVRAGQRVAICDQIEDPRFTKKLVKRGVTELVTPGVAYSDTVLESGRNNYLASIILKKEKNGIALLDISTGEFWVAEGNQEYIEKLLQSFQPAEILFNKSQRNIFEQNFGQDYNVYFLDEWFFEYEFGFDKLTQHFQTPSLKGFGIENLSQGIAAAGAVMHYLKETHQNNIKHISRIARLEEDKYVWLDRFTMQNLELLSPQQEEGVTLANILDHTLSPMGARLLRKWIALPLKNKSKIEERLHLVEFFVKNQEFREQINENIKLTGDLERLISKVASRRVKPRELLQIKKALKQSAELKLLLQNQNDIQLKKFSEQINPCNPLYEKIEKVLLDEPKNILNDGGLIKSKVNEALDELHDIVKNSKAYLEKIRQKAAQETGITSLKIDYNKVFGYYLEVSNTHKRKVPKVWIRKQTLTSAERYITEELKIYEDKIVGAEEKIIVLEQKIYQELIIEAMEFVLPIQQNARVIATLDCLYNFAFCALKYRYSKPIVQENSVIQIKEGRHPVIERQLPPDSPYVPNDVFLDDDSQQIIVITGPNMSGKSAMLRQVALITLMAQMGSFVPAKFAEIGLVDKVFTRVGASDNLAKGESTFMVEMMETASIMNNLSDRSLVIMDEIGRGTSTYDGISIAWAILEYLHNHSQGKPKTLFATHYHELNELAKDLNRVKNFHIAVKELDNRVVFLRKLTEGGSEHSFGIHVAEMAGMPQKIVLRSQEIMRHLESQRTNQDNKETLQNLPQDNTQLNFFQAENPALEKIGENIKNLDLNALSPIEALLKLNEWQKKLKT